MGALAGFDPDEAARIAAWPLRSAVAAYEAKQIQEAREDYLHDRIEYLMQAPWAKKESKLKPPETPEILKG